MVADRRDSPLDALAQRFVRFAERECKGVSPLYYRLAHGIAGDPELLALAAEALPGQPVPNLFLGAVHALLLDGAQHPLSGFYPSVAGDDSDSDDPCPAFRQFCLEHRDDIRALITTRLVQTNEVRRCACLLPAFGLAARLAGDRPLALVEIGASAGLNLLFDRYCYDYGAGRLLGNPDSPVQLRCEPRGPLQPPLPSELPLVAARVGMELNPIDVRDEAATRWLHALVWPEHAERAELLQRALELASQDPPPLVAGDALELLPSVVADLPSDAAICVFHTHTVNQFSPEARQRLADLLVGLAAERALFRVSIEGFGRDRPLLSLTSFENGAARELPLAHCDGHGAWLEWLADGPAD